MVIYVEYAFAENFLVDGALLWLSMRAARQKISWKRLSGGAAIGGVFALVFPLLTLPVFLAYTLKFTVGCLLCLIAFGRVKTKNEWGRYAFTAVCFFALTFLYGGALIAAGAGKTHAVFGVALLSVFAAVWIKKLYEKRAVHRYVYACSIAYKQRHVAALGFYDSGNFARHKNLPVCFLSPEVAFEVWGEETFGEEGGQVCEETKIKTMNGEKNVRLFKGKLKIENEGKKYEKEVYFSVSANMLCRDYQLILHSCIFEVNGKEEEKKQ